MLELLARGAPEADGGGRGEGPAEADVRIKLRLTLLSSRGSSVGLDLVAMLFLCRLTTDPIRHGVTIAHEEHDEEGPTSSAEDSRGHKVVPGSKRVFQASKPRHRQHVIKTQARQLQA